MYGDDAWFEVEEGCYCLKMGLVTQSCSGNGGLINESHYEDLSKEMGVDKRIFKAIAKNETKSSAFITQNPKHAKILLERHYVYRLLKPKRADVSDLVKKYPTLIHSSITSGGYGTYKYQINRLEDVKKWDYEVAIQSCSWGMFQVMGEYYKQGYPTVEDFEQAMNTCEIQHLYYFRIFIEKVKGVRLINAMKNKDWEGIAKYYNGGKWKKYNPNYPSHLKKHYDEIK